MSATDQRAVTSSGEDEGGDHEESDSIRDIYALSTPDHHPHRAVHRNRPRDASWSSQSTAVSEGGTSENFSTISREFNALVVAGSALDGSGGPGEGDGGGTNLARIGEEEETNPLAIVPEPGGSHSPRDRGPDPRRVAGWTTSSLRASEGVPLPPPLPPPSVQRVKEEEVEAKITAWQTAELAKVNNRFKREDAVINGWEGERVQKATSRMKKVERKLEEKRARAMEKMENEVAKAHKKAEERRASAEAKRGTKVARVIELANLMRAVGKAPVKRSFFKFTP